MSAWHVTAVNYIWKLQAFSGANIVEAITANMLPVSDSNALARGLNVFGMLWRYTGGIETFHIPKS
jgi:hypothetical protein